MTGAAGDLDLFAASDPGTPPQQLADIAARRHDLHAIILANPQTYPELRQWIEQVSPAAAISMHSPPSAFANPPYAGDFGAYAAPTKPRRTGLGWIFAGCGCLTLIVGIILVLVVVGGLGATSPRGNGTEAPDAAGPTVGEDLAAIQGEIVEYQALVDQLDGNPVAALVAPPLWFERFQQRAAARPLNESQIRSLAEEIGAHKQQLQDRLTDAQTRRDNASDSIAEDLVDRAGNGFIDIRWDADSACSASEKPGVTTAGCTSSDPLAIHILPDGKRLGGDPGTRLTVLHELAHLYQYADVDSTPVQEKSESMKLKDQGLFRGSGEAMADCYALTYLNADSLTVNGATLGYGYVCNETERQAIREWAEKINAPMSH